ncbi:hypothetical protein [Tropicibacter alexandrii]|uniref:hypothetical protein n=1 Tax=Tropicibacter alexandrii TaxID=2267683 RepID=UPI000EF4B575|nr:hypothetical protein [Tropicibacter alexandrii]
MRLLAMMLALFAAPAWSLSCMRPDLVEAFKEVQADSAEWVIVRGRFSFDESRLPEPMSGKDTTLPARIDGKALSRKGFTTPFADDVSVHVTCSGPWCGTLGAGVSYIAFLRKTGDDYTTVASACPSSLFFHAGKPAEKALTACLRGRCPEGRDRP